MTQHHHQQENARGRGPAWLEVYVAARLALRRRPEARIRTIDLDDVSTVVLVTEVLPCGCVTGVTYYVGHERLLGGPGAVRSLAVEAAATLTRAARAHHAPLN